MAQRKFTYYILTLLLLALTANGLSAQEKKESTKKQLKAFTKLQDERDAELDEKMEKKRKKHEELQTKNTQKRMKQNKRKARRIQQNKHPDNFFQRLFKKKPKGR